LLCTVRLCRHRTSIQLLLHQQQQQAAWAASSMGSNSSKQQHASKLLISDTAPKARTLIITHTHTQFDTTDTSGKRGFLSFLSHAGNHEKK